MISNDYHYSASAIQQHLDHAISHVTENIGCYCSDPGVDFTRNRKFGCKELIKHLIHLSDRSINSDLMNYYDSVETMPSASAVCQQRGKLDPEALERVFHLFTGGFENYKTIPLLYPPYIRSL